MTPQLRNLLILLAGIAVVLILIILFFSGNSRFMRFISRILEEKERTTYQPKPKRKKAEIRVNTTTAQPVLPVVEQEQHVEAVNVQKKTAESIVEMATLIQKSDDRLRIIESTGQERLVDEYYELIFVTRKGQKLKIECSKEAYEKIPFNQQGSLTYKKNKLVKFKYYEDIVYNN